MKTYSDKTNEDSQECRFRDFIVSMYKVSNMNQRQRERLADTAHLAQNDYWSLVDHLAVRRYQEKKRADEREIAENGYRPTDYALALIYTTSLSLEEITAISKQIPVYEGMEDIAEHLAKRRFQNIQSMKKEKTAQKERDEHSTYYRDF
jgi:hypothetical protein